MKRILIMAILAVGALTVSGCSSAAPQNTMSVALDRGIVSAPELAYRDSAAHAENTADGPRAVITTGELIVTVESPQDAADDAATIVERLGGHVSGRTERAATDRDPGAAQLTLRIPADSLSSALSDLKALGDAREIALHDTDVTEESQDLTARITALQASVDRLLELMVGADSTADLITIEQALSQRQSNLESLQSKLRALEDQVALATIALQLVAEQNTPPDEPDTFWSGLVTGWNAFVGFWATMLVAIGVVSPWLVLIGVVAVAVVLIARASARRNRMPEQADSAGSAVP